MDLRQKALVKGTRIAVELVLGLLGRGYTVEQVLQQYELAVRTGLPASSGVVLLRLRAERP